jgi:GTP-binding protein
MIIRTAEYIRSCVSVKQCPKHSLPEYAFIGRSNVGKSSLINMILNRKDLSKTSAKPGKTRTINFFLVNKSWYLVDLPGFGFAKVSKEIRQQWDNMILEYILNRKNLACVFMLIDSRISLQEKDKNFMLLLGKNLIPFVIISTKIDKTNLQHLSKHKKELYNFLDIHWEIRPQHILTSSVEKKGQEEILSVIESANKVFCIK